MYFVSHLYEFLVIHSQLKSLVMRSTISRTVWAAVNGTASILGTTGRGIFSQRGRGRPLNVSGILRGERLLSTTAGTTTLVVDGLSNQIVNSGDISSNYAKEVADILSDYEERKKRKQSLIGTVVSTSNTKTISVQVTRQKFFPKYNKVLNARKKIMAHDEDEISNLGDTVRIVPCRPMSKMKRHKIIDIVKKNVV